MCGRSPLSASGDAVVLTGNARLYCDERALAYVLLTPARNCYESSSTSNQLVEQVWDPHMYYVGSYRPFSWLYFLYAMAFCNELVCEAIQFAMNRLGFEMFKDKQREAVCAFVGGRNTFVILPTGYGKSVIYTILPTVFDRLRGWLTVCF